MNKTLGAILAAGLVLAGCRTSPAPSPSPTVVADPADAAVQRLGDEKTRAEARKEIADLGTAAVPALIAHARDPKIELRWEVANLLGVFADAAALPVLAKDALEDENPHVRWRALWALSRVGKREDIVAALRPGLNSPSAGVRWNAALGLSFFDDPGGLSLLEEGVRNPDPFHRWEAINALSRVHDASTIATLRIPMQSPSVRDRNETVLTLGAIGGPEAVSMLMNALTDESPEVRWRAAMALGRAGDPSVLGALRSVADHDTDGNVREHAAKAATQIERKAGRTGSDL